ncbi:MAG: bifunctional precorrin-2 dehydrogenase/sirohydrochlorin ferrochelatase [Candidatus Hadarchaeales archaeon]
MFLPLYVDLHGKRVLVIGLGKVGKRRARKLSDAGAEVTAIDQKKANVKGIKFIRKKLTPESLPLFRGYFLVVASTDNTELNEAIAKKAMREGCLVNRADLHDGGDVIFPATVKVGEGVLSFSTFGKNPKISKRVKEVLERELSRG